MAWSLLEGNGNGNGKRPAAYPPLDIIDHGDVLLVRALVPGISREQLEVSVESHHLFLRARPTPSEESGTYYRHERTFNRFERAVDLPVAVDPDRTHAHLENGVLELTLPKREPDLPRRVEVH